jgi:hypothetical protein
MGPFGKLCALIMGALSVAAEATVACKRVLRFMLSPVLVVKMACLQIKV